MIRTVLDILKQQRLAWSSAIVVVLFLTVFGRAPVAPVVAGCILALSIAILRAWPAAVAQRGGK